MKKLIIQRALVKSILKNTTPKESALDILNKALGHKYIDRWPKKTGKGWEYLYPKDLLSPFKKLLQIFNFKKEKIEEDYTKNNIQKDYGADKKTFAAHVLMYFSSKLKWDAFFAKKENQDKYKKPQKMGGKPTKKTGGVSGAGTGTGAAGPGGTIGDPAEPGKSGKGVDKGKKNGDNKNITVNKSLMRKIWGMYGAKEDQNATDQPENQSGKLPGSPKAVRSGGSKGTGDQHGNGAEAGNDSGEPIQLPLQPGERPARDVRVTKKQAQDIRQACIDLLNSKTDSEMTEEDKSLLRQFEGAGGLGSEDASVHGTLYEFYTPRNVTKKVWEIVDKYIPGAKSVLEPSAGIGRFAEDRPNDKFTLNEFDDISSRISGILHPGADIKHGAFQEMFKPGKDYAGKKYDVVIGNPPYGKYNGIWKGRGEGKGHNRYEEYFIDRGLDTLREGGIMAFVVPSGFLRGANDKIKEKIASKGRLLEAWRIPNGTFNTTDVGTDIVIIRKEKGDPAAFSNNAYFGENPQMVIGDETTRTGRFGDEKYVALKDGETFDGAIDRIKADAVEAVPMGEKTEKDQALGGGVTVEVEESDAEKKKNRSDAMKGNDNAKKDGGPGDEPPAPDPGATDTLEEFNKKYNKHFDPQDLKIMRYTRWDDTIDLSRIGPAEIKYMKSSGNYVEVSEGNWVSVANFASGNIYQKLTDLEGAKDSLPAGEYKRQKELLEAAMPPKKTVFDFTVSPISDFAETYKIETLNGSESLNGAFKRWLWDLDSANIPPAITKNDIQDYVNRKSVRADRSDDKLTSQLEREQTVRVRREATENLYNQFIREELPIQEQERLADKWNRQFNAMVQPDHTKIPAFVDGISKTFKGNPLKVSNIQLKGVSTLVNRGNGILAYDVGVGKTLTGILATVSQIQTGRAKRPLICVPKAVYKNWISEIKQLFPGIKVNELNNFRSMEAYKNADGSLNIPEGSLSVCTYEALQSVSFKKETIDNVLMADFAASQQVSDENDSQRKQADELETISTKLGKATKSTDQSVFWEDTGFDHITIDEMHNFKNVFAQAKAKSKGEANEFQGLTGGTPSDRAMKAFAITQLIQRENNGRNVFGLTATPFTNSPIEIYNILSLVARDELKEAGIFNLHEFMAQFALLKSELAPTAKGGVESRTVMKEFKNLSALQNLINTYIDKVDGEEAGILRPNKNTHLVDINMTAEQKEIYDDIINYMNNADPREDPGATLRGLNALRALTVSPALLKGSRFGNNLADSDFVKSSPKMTFVCDSAAKLYKQKPQNGQVIYLPEGVEYFKDVKKYLAKKGIPEDAVAFLSPEYLPAGDKGNDRKEEIMKDFNDPNGKIKIIIGSGTIKEGVNLNGNTTTLYNCMLGWNPTETVQVEGRIHRQGNKQGEVHIVYPLMNDTVDSFMYQKHDEKSKRISAVFSYKGNTLNVEDIDPEELKFNLIKDPRKRADLQIKQEVEEINNRVLLAQGTCDKILNAYQARKELAENANEYTAKIATIKKAGKEFAELSDEELIKRYGNKYDDEDESFDARLEEFSGLGSAWVEAKNPKEFRKEYENRADRAIKVLQRQIASAKGKSDTLDATLRRYNVDPSSEKSASAVAKKFGVEAAELKEKIEKIKKNVSQYIDAATRQIEEYTKLHPGKSVDQAILDTTATIEGNLRPMADVEKEIVTKREAQAKPMNKSVKKMVLIMKRRTA